MPSTRRSIEPEGMPGILGSVEGMTAIRAKGRAFDELCLAVHEIRVSEPLIAGDFFSVVMAINATYKEGGRRSMEELCVYEVHKRKVLREQFFYRPV